MVDDKVVIPAGAGVQGRVVEAQSAGRFSGKPGLVIEVTRLAYNGESYELSSNQYSKQGSSRTTRAAATIGGGAGVGALMAGDGGGRGAAIGAMIGAGAGTGVQAKAKPPEVQLPVETMLSFRLENPLTVVPASTLQGMQGSDPSQDPFSSDERPVLKRRPGSRPASRTWISPAQVHLRMRTLQRIRRRRHRILTSFCFAAPDWWQFVGWGGQNWYTDQPARGIHLPESGPSSWRSSSRETCSCRCAQFAFSCLRSWK